LVYKARGQVGVYRHLLAWHRVEAEARRDLGDAARAFRDDHEVHDEQDREQDHSDHHVPAHEEAAERAHDVARRPRALVAVGEDQPRRRDLQGKAQQGGEQQQRREAREVERTLEEQGYHEHEHGGGDGEGEAQVEQRRRQRQDEDGEQRHDAERQAHVGAGVEAAEAGGVGLEDGGQHGGGLLGVDEGGQ
jgi:hypothetical protein